MASTVTYQIYYSSRTGPNGEMWCPDCVAVEATLDRLFNQADGPHAEVIYVGDRAIWKNPNNEFRQGPLKITGVPTLLKFRGGEVVGRLNEDGILDEGVMKKFLEK